MQNYTKQNNCEFNFGRVIFWQNLMENILLKKWSIHERKGHKHQGYIKFSVLVFNDNLHNIFSTVFPISQLKKNSITDTYQVRKIFSWLIIHPYLYMVMQL